MTPIDDRITTWLDRLEAELAADDPAMRHDAVAEAREHLCAARDELPDEASDADVHQLLDEYGEPAEIAHSYRDAERLLHGDPPSFTAATPRMPAAAGSPRSSTAPAVERTPGWFGVVRDADAWAALFYMLLALPLGIAGFVWTVAGGATTGSLLILIVGVPLALAFLASIRGIALLEGRIVEALLGERMPRRGRPGAGSGSGVVHRVGFWLRDRRTWTSMAYLLTMLPLGIAYFVSAVVGISVSGALLGSPIVLGVAAASGDTTVEWWSWLLCIPSVPAGALGFLGTLHLARAVGAAQGRYTKAMLVGGDGAASRRDPVSPGASLVRAAVLLALAAVLGGAATAAGAGIEHARTTSVTRTLEADEIRSLDLDLSDADVQFAEDDTLDAGEVAVDAELRVLEDDTGDPDDVTLRAVGGRGTLHADCDSSFGLFSAGCRIHLTVRVAPEGDLSVGGGTDNGDIDLGGRFTRVDLHSDNGDIEGLVDAEQVALTSDNGDIAVALGEAAEQVQFDTDNGDVTVQTSGRWDVEAAAGNGEVQIAVDDDPDAERSLHVETDNGDITVGDEVRR